MKVWHKELNEIGANYALISGVGSLRLENAITQVNDFLENKKL
jgi:hypothetical protein